MVDVSDAMGLQVIAMDSGKISPLFPTAGVQLGDIPTSTRTSLAADPAFTTAYPPILVATGVKTADYTAKIGDLVLVNCTSGNVVITAPAGAAAGQRFAVRRMDGSANSVTVARAGSDTFAIGTGTATSHVLTLQDRVIVFVSSGNGTWFLAYGYQSLTAMDSRYLPVATGNATLVGGTVTVANTSITTNSIIRLSYKTLGGTPGAVYVSARTASTSFAITSTSGTDTSVIYYEILAY